MTRVSSNTLTQHLLRNRKERSWFYEGQYPSRRHYISRKVALATWATSVEDMLEIGLVYMVLGK